MGESILKAAHGPALERPTSAVIWECRAAWARTRTVRLSLSDRCLVENVIGQIRRIAVTGAFVEVDGWEVPAEEILAVGFPTLVEIEEYRQTRRKANEVRAEALEG